MFKSKICPICKQTFVPNASTQLYCSKTCWQTIKNNRRNKNDRTTLDSLTTRKCLVCGIEFAIQPRSVTKKYCSDKCSRQAERLFGNKTQRDLDYKDKIRYGGNKYIVLERDNYTCQLCENTTQLVIHHKDFSGQSELPNNDVDNLITLCRRCHINLHKKFPFNNFNEVI